MISSKMLIVGILAALAVAFAVGYGARDRRSDVDNSPSPTPSATPSASPVAATATPRPVAHTVRLTAAGPQPKALTVRVGDSVTFVNEAPFEYWPASDPHPTHDRCPGLDARRGLRQGDTYALTLTERRTCTYHSHLDPFNTALTGSIVVQ
jgi:hypothetical protein